MRYLFLFFILLSNLFSGWCIIHSSQKKIFLDKDVRFYKKYPLGVIAFEKGWYIFKSGPYIDLIQVKKILKKLKKSIQLLIL